MAHIEKRVSKSGKIAKNYTIYYYDETGRKRSKIGYPGKAETENLAAKLENRVKRIRDGLLTAAEVAQEEATKRKLADHIADYVKYITSKGDKEKHAKHISGTLTRVLKRAKITSINRITPDAIESALGDMRDEGLSARTRNHALGAVKAFANWLDDNDRIVDHKLRRLKPKSEEDDRRRERRALTGPQLLHLLATTYEGKPLQISKNGWKYEYQQLTGPERAMIYRLACETGFRANEIRSLTRDSFRLDDEPPVIVVQASNTKNKKEARQPIRPAFAAELREWLPTRPEKGPIIKVPEKTAKMLKKDLEAAGIPYRDGRGEYVDFHALRATFVTLLIQGGADVKTVQVLARHSTPTLTIQRYAKTGDKQKADALDTLPKPE